jgi:hypothetical protein
MIQTSSSTLSNENINIYIPNYEFDFSQLVLLNPTVVNGGNYFIKCRVKNAPLYIQAPQSKTRQGILKIGKRYGCELLFTQDDTEFIQWMENLETIVKNQIYENRQKWFETSLEKEDIDNSFTPSIKNNKNQIFILKTNIPTTIGSLCNLKVYNENQEEIDIETIDKNTNVMTILEIQGIKCSQSNFQIEIEIKQMMTVNPTNVFERFLFKKTPTMNSTPNVLIHPKSQFSLLSQPEPETDEETQEPHPEEKIKQILLETNISEPDIVPPENKNTMNEITDIELHLDEIGEEDPIKLKKRDLLFYEMYREARRRAKIARDLAISSYLEAKNIKNIYKLNDIEESESDLDGSSDDDEDDDEDDNEITIKNKQI